jgi:O-antigen/teichoic acid export membrane protein
MSLKRDFATGVVWSVIGNGANNLISFVVFAIIANVVSPTELGVASFAIVLVELGRLVNTAGIPELLIQRPRWDDDYAAVAFWVNIALAAVLTLVSCAAVAPIIEHTFAEGSGLALVVLSGCFLIDAIRVVQEAKLRREFKYRKLAARGSTAGILSGIVGVTLALTGFGLWALIAQRLLHSTLTTALTWLASDWRPRFFWSTAELAQILSNGSRLMAAGLLGTLGARVPDLILGATLGPIALAIYRVGSRGYDALTQLFIWPVGNAATSGFSRVAAVGDVDEAYIESTRFLALIAYPIFFGAAATAPQFITLAFGSTWSEASLVMAALCLIVAPATLSSMLRPALISLRLTHELLRINIFIVVSVALASFAGLPFGATGIALALAIRAYLALIFNLMLIQRYVGVKPLRLLKTVMPPFLSAVIMLGVAVAVGDVLVAGWPAWAQLLLMIVTGAMIYPLALWLFWREFTRVALREVADMAPPLGRLLRRILPQQP